MLVFVLVRFLGMIRSFVLRVLMIRLVTVLVGVRVLMRMTVLDVSMTVFVIVGMSVFALVFHGFSSLHFRRILHLQRCNVTASWKGRGAAAPANRRNLGSFTSPFNEVGP